MSATCLILFMLDYFGRTRDTAHPFHGPFEASEAGTQAIRVWPKP